MTEELAEEKHDRRAARGRRSRRLTHGARGLGGARSSQPAGSSWHRQWRVLRRAAAALGPIVGELEISGRDGALNRRVAAAACVDGAVGNELYSANGK